VKFVHAADLHLDSPLRGLPAYEGAPVDEVRGATRRALENLVELCVEESAALLVIAGDLYDGDWKDYSTGLFFVQQMARLRDAGVHVAWVRGNHDASSKITRHLNPPENVTELSFSAPETVLYEDCGVAVHGVGYATAEVRDNLALSYPEPRSGLFNLGLLHTSLDGRPGHAPYAPCALDQLRARGYDYWALGHVHAREVLSREPWVVFSGNLQGRHIQEVGPKGATLVTVEGGQVRAAEPRALDVVRWARCEVDIEGAADLDEALERAAGELRKLLLEAEGRLVACRVTLHGRSPAHGALVARSERVLAELRALGLGAGGVYIERVELRSGPAVDLPTVRQREDAIGELFRSLEELRSEGEALEELRAEVLRGLEGLAQDVVRSESDAEELLDAAERLLSGRLLGPLDAEPRP
jgi:DNA repair exonuclease SbcCD nuclease subunit